MIFLAHVVLVIGLLLVRRARIDGSETPYITVQFIGLFVMTCVLIAVAVFVQRWTGFRRLTSILGIVLIPGIVALLGESFRPYSGPFVIWGAFLLGGSFLQVMQIPASSLQRASGIVAALVAPFILLEIALRLYFGLFGTIEQRVAYIYPVERALALSSRFEGLPYVNYGLSTLPDDHNAAGYRGLPLDDRDTFRIFALGGSTTYGTSIRAVDAYPAQLQRVLRDEYGYTSVEVVNAGVESYASYDSLANFLYRVLDDRPDVVLVYHGVNDVRARLVDPAYYDGLNRQRGIWSPQQLQADLPASTLLRFVGIQLGFTSNPNQWETVLAIGSEVQRCSLVDPACPTLGQPATEILAQNPPIYLERNLRNIVATARAHDIGVALATWGYYVGDTIVANPFTEGFHLRIGVDEQNELIRALAAELDVLLIDFAAAPTDNAQYWQDGMHLTPSGTRLQAEFFAAALADYLAEMPATRWEAVP